MERYERMKIIAGDRATGRTTELIKIAIERNAYILVCNRARALCIRQLSVKMGLPQLLFPITLHEFLTQSYNTGFVHDLLIDDADELLQQMAISKGWRLKAISICKRKESFIELEEKRGGKMDENGKTNERKIYRVFRYNDNFEIVEAKEMHVQEIGGHAFYIFSNDGQNVAAFPFEQVHYITSKSKEDYLTELTKG